MIDFDNLMKKIDYLARINPAMTHPPLSQLGKAALKPSYKPMSKEQARKALLKLGPDEIEKLYDEEIARQREQREREEKKLFFHQSYYDADFNHSGKKALWSIDEGITVILGKDPRKVKWDDIKNYSHLSPLVKKFEEMKELALSYKNAGQLTEPAVPAVFLAWAERMGFAIPETLQEVVCALGVQIADWQTLYKQAAEIIAFKNKKIEILEDKLNKLQVENEQLTHNFRLLLDEDSEFYSLEIDAANIIQNMVIKNFDKSVSFKEQATKYLDKIYPNLSSEAKKRIAIMLNPTACKLGGRPKEENNL